MISISIVVPVYSGEAFLENLTEAVDELRKRLIDEGAPFSVDELVFVDDGAIDGSAVIMQRIASKREWVTAVHLSRNFGQHPATVAGILHTSGDWVVTLDEDLQHPPNAIRNMIAIVGKTGADVVYGNPISAVHQSVFRDMSSRGYKMIMKRVIGVRHINEVNSFRLIRGPIARAAASICTNDTFFDVALVWFTQRVQSFKLDLKDQRFIRTGKSGYRFRSLISHARRMAMSGQMKVLRLAALFGMAMLLFSFLVGASLLLLKLFIPDSIPLQGWTSLILAICFFSGLILFMIGLALEYLSVLVMQAHGKPSFFVIDRSSDVALADYAPKDGP